MRLSRFFVDQPLALGQHDLPETQAHYIGRVLRHATGDAVQLFDGSGREYLGELVEVGKKNVRVELREQFAGQPDSPLRIHLGQGLSRGERMDWAIQKATELGVAEITPIVSERCEVRLKDERADKRPATLAPGGDQRLRAVRPFEPAADPSAAGPGGLAARAGR